MNLWLRLLRVRLAAARKAAVSLWDTSAVRFRVTVGDLDTVGHMNNGRYLTLLDLGRLDLMVRSGLWARCQKLSWVPVVAGQTITYWKDLKLGQSFEVNTRILGIDDRWFYLEQQFRRGETVHAQAVIRGCFIKPGQGRVSVEELESELDDIPDQRVVPDWVRSWTQDSSVKAAHT